MHFCVRAHARVGARRALLNASRGRCMSAAFIRPVMAGVSRMFRVMNLLMAIVCFFVCFSTRCCSWLLVCVIKMWAINNQLQQKLSEMYMETFHVIS